MKKCFREFISLSVVLTVSFDSFVVVYAVTVVVVIGMDAVTVVVVVVGVDAFTVVDIVGVTVVAVDVVGGAVDVFFCPFMYSNRFTISERL